MAQYDSDGQGADLASKEGARTLSEARSRVNKAIYYLDVEVTGAPQVAALDTRLADGSPMPEVHASLLMYFRQLEPHIYVRAEPHWTGEQYEEPVAEVKIPQGPAISGESMARGRHTIDTIDGLRDLTDWEMMSVEVGAEQTQCYLSPDAIVSCYRKLHKIQHQLGLSVQPRDGSQRRTDGPSRI